MYKQKILEKTQVKIATKEQKQKCFAPILSDLYIQLPKPCPSKPQQAHKYNYEYLGGEIGEQKIRNHETLNDLSETPKFIDQSQYGKSNDSTSFHINNLTPHQNSVESVRNYAPESEIIRGYVRNVMFKRKLLGDHWEALIKQKKKMHLRSSFNQIRQHTSSYLQSQSRHLPKQQRLVLSGCELLIQAMKKMMFLKKQQSFLKVKSYRKNHPIFIINSSNAQSEEEFIKNDPCSRLELESNISKNKSAKSLKRKTILRKEARQDHVKTSIRNESNSSKDFSSPFSEQNLSGLILGHQSNAFQAEQYDSSPSFHMKRQFPLNETDKRTVPEYSSPNQYGFMPIEGPHTHDNSQHLNQKLNKKLKKIQILNKDQPLSPNICFSPSPKHTQSHQNIFWNRQDQPHTDARQRLQQGVNQQLLESNNNVKYEFNQHNYYVVPTPTNNHSKPLVMSSHNNMPPNMRTNMHLSNGPKSNQNMIRPHSHYEQINHQQRDHETVHNERLPKFQNNNHLLQYNNIQDNPHRSRAVSASPTIKFIHSRGITNLNTNPNTSPITNPNTNPINKPITNPINKLAEDYCLSNSNDEKGNQGNQFNSHQYNNTRINSNQINCNKISINSVRSSNMFASNNEGFAHMLNHNNNNADRLNNNNNEMNLNKDYQQQQRHHQKITYQNNNLTNQLIHQNIFTNQNPPAFHINPSFQENQFISSSQSKDLKTGYFSNPTSPKMHKGISLLQRRSQMNGQNPPENHEMMVCGRKSQHHDYYTQKEIGSKQKDERKNVWLDKNSTNLIRYEELSPRNSQQIHERVTSGGYNQSHQTGRDAGSMRQSYNLHSPNNQFTPNHQTSPRISHQQKIVVTSNRQRIQK